MFGVITVRRGAEITTSANHDRHPSISWCPSVGEAVPWCMAAQPRWRCRDTRREKHDDTRGQARRRVWCARWTGWAGRRQSGAGRRRRWWPYRSHARWEQGQSLAEAHV